MNILEFARDGKAAKLIALLDKGANIETVKTGTCTTCSVCGSTTGCG